MKQRLAFIDQILTEAGLHQDIVTYKILPLVRQLEQEIAEKIKAMNTTTFTFFVPPEPLGPILILRHDPQKHSGGQVISSQTHMLKWSHTGPTGQTGQTTDEITPGQWIRGKKVLKMSDLNHDGSYFIYGLQVRHDHSIVVLSRPTYFTGLTVMEDLDDFCDFRPGSKHVGGVWLTEENANFFTDRPVHVHSFTLPGLTFHKLNGQIPNGIHYVPHTPNYQQERRAARRESRKTELLRLKNDELREMCRAKKLRTSGVKAELVNRLITEEDAKAAETFTPCSQRIEMRQGCTPCLIRGRSVSIVDGHLIVDGKKVHNFLKDEFYCLPPPENYSIM